MANQHDKVALTILQILYTFKTFGSKKQVSLIQSNLYTSEKTVLGLDRYPFICDNDHDRDAVSDKQFIFPIISV